MNRDALSKTANIGRIVREDIQQILDEKDKTSVLKLEPTYKSVFNQPERVAISSASAIPATEITSSIAETSFYSFVVNLPRPALNVKDLQLLSANIPQAQVCIPDDSLVFYYYRLQTQNIEWYDYEPELTYNPGDYVTFNGKNYECIQTTTGIEPAVGIYWKESDSVKYETPNIFNLYCVRLLPSYYKKELIIGPENFGYNNTFNSYEELQTQLQATCTNRDLALNSGGVTTTIAGDVTQDYLPNGFFDANVVGNWTQDISITYDSTINKFKFKGENINTPFEIPLWDAVTYYPPQSLVEYLGETYYNITPEIGNYPDGPEPTSWFSYEADENTIWNTYLAAGFNDPNVIKLQGAQTTLDWNEYHRFLPSEATGIYYKGNYWNPSKTNQATIPPIGVWNADVQYSIGDTVYYTTTGLSYICIVAPGPAAPLWNSATKYYLGDTMTWEDGNDYQADTDYIPVGWSPGDGALVFTTWDYEQFNPGNIVTDPSFSPSSTYWLCTAQTTGLNPLDYPLYTSIPYFAIGDRVRYPINIFDGPYNLVVWEALYENHAQSPYENPERWQILPSALPPAQAPEYWESIVLPDPPWINLGASKNPSNPTYWAETYNPWTPSSEPSYTGVNYISKKFDFALDPAILQNNVYGIPGQPFIDTSLQLVIKNETLNKRLGFSWTGQNMLIPFEVIPDFTAGSLVTLFFNRLRPVPDYTLKGLEALRYRALPNLTADQQATYTADAFCNMVYSSIVNIYTRILGGSTTDTIRNTNLLAIVPMSCGNLGVTLFNSFIDNPLTKIDSDIYTIEVQFRTESGQPYWLSNNAVVTLQLKMGYD